MAHSEKATRGTTKKGRLVRARGKDGLPRTPNSKSLAIRRSLLDAATTLFSERGYRATNFQDIADALGMSRPGLYYHFASKEALLEALVAEVTLTGTKENEAEDKRGVGPADALQARLEKNILRLLAHPKLFLLLERSENDLPPALRQKHDEGKRAHLLSLVTIIDQGISVGQFRPVDSTIAAFGIIGMCNWTAWWFKPDGRLNDREVAQSLADAAVRSVLRADAHRSRSEQVGDILRILREDVSHLERTLNGY